MHVANEAKNMIRLWGDAFMPYASSGRGRVIVEGYQDMQRDGMLNGLPLTSRHPIPSSSQRHQVGAPHQPSSPRS